MEHGFVNSILEAINDVGLTNILALVSDTGGSGLNFIKGPEFIGI
jgi:hypothetical protein